MAYRYHPVLRTLKRWYRRIRPVPRSPWTAGAVQDICAVNLVPPEKLISFFSHCLSVLQKIRGERVGDYLEFGIFNGNSIGSMYLAQKEAGVSMRLFGFDAFEGLPAGAEQEDGGVWKKGFYACSFEQMQECLARREVPVDEITWEKGWYDQTLTQETAKRLAFRLGVVFVDCDTYSSSKAVLNFIRPHIVEPFIICFDDWKLNDLDLAGMGEYQSFNEFLEENPTLRSAPLSSYNRKSRTFLVWPEKKLASV